MDKSEASQIKGFLIPIFSSYPDQDGNVLHGLAPTDMRKVVDGYACANCLAEFNHYTVHCPACNTRRNIEADLKAAPQFWTDYLRERELDEPPDKPPVVNPFAHIDAHMRNREVEVERLGNRGRKWGRGA